MKLEELHIYGSQRLGMRTKPVHVSEGNVEGGLVNMLEVKWKTFGGIDLTCGDKRYELTNHLGNVLMVITDRKLLFSREGVRYFTADQVSFTDYYPFGLEMRDVYAMVMHYVVHFGRMKSNLPDAQNDPNTPDQGNQLELEVFGRDIKRISKDELYENGKTMPAKKNTVVEERELFILCCNDIRLLF